MPIGGGALVGASNGGAFTVQADLSGTPFGGAPTWTDITEWVLTDEDPPISIGWGRQDEDSDLQPRTCSMTLDNSDGRFTPGYTAGPYGNAVDVGVRLRVSITVNGTTFVRFDGYVNDWDAGWDNGGPMSTCMVDASDILAVMGTKQPLRSIYAEELLLLAPTSFYPLDEPSTAITAGDITGKLAAVVVKTSKNGAGTVTFGTDIGLLGAATGVALTSPDAGGSSAAARGSFLSVPNGLPAGAGWTMGVTFVGPSAHPGFIEQIIFLPPLGGVTAGMIDVHVNTSGALGFQVVGQLTLLASSGVRDVCDGKPHNLLLELTADGKTLNVYIDGVLDKTVSVGIAVGWVNNKQNIVLGMQYSDLGVANAAFAGTLANFFTAAAVFSAATAAALDTAMRTAFAGETTDQHALRLLTYRPNTGSSLDPGRGTVGAHDTAGITLQQALLDTGKAEAGVVYADGQGRVALPNRAHLYNPVVALTLDASLDQVTASLQFRRDTQDILNDVTYSRSGGAAQRAVDAASTAKYGVRAKTDTLIVNGDRDAADAAGWAVAVDKTVKTKSPQLEVDLFTEPSSVQAAAVLAAAPLTVANVTNLPAATSPASAVKIVIQGGTETIGVDEWHIGFYTTPLLPGTLRADAAASANTKLDNGLVIPS